MTEAKKSLLQRLRPMWAFVVKYRKFYFIGILALIAVDILEIFPPLILKKGIDGLTAGELTPDNLLTLAGVYILIALGQGVLRYLWRMYIIRTSMMAGDDMRQNLFSHLTTLSPDFFRKRRVGELVSLATNDIQSIRFALGPTILIFIDAILYLCLILPVMFSISPKLTAISMLPLILVPIFTLRMEKLIHKYFSQVQERFADMAADSQESIGGVRVVKGAAIETSREESFERLGDTYVDANIKSSLSHSALDMGLGFFLSSSITLLFLVGGSLVIGETVTIGTFVAFQLYIQKMTWPMEAIGLTITFLQRALASQERLNEVLEEEHPLAEVETKPVEETEHLEKRIPTIRIDGLNLRYSNSSDLALNDIKLEIHPGMRLGIVGPIGSGKSTLLNCIAGLEPVTSGTIFVEGEDINLLPKRVLRNLIGIVPQDSFLFSETLLDNVLYGSESFFSKNVEKKISHVNRAASLACIQEEIEAFPAKHETKLGERGLNVSGGQKQRLTIARALAINPKILIFDDCLSAVDSKTESKLRSAFNEFSRNRTFIFATHRVSSLLNMDEVIVMDEGKIVEQGDPDTLMKQNGYFTRLVEQQTLSQQNLAEHDIDV